MFSIIAEQLKDNKIKNKRCKRYNKNKNQNLDDSATQEIITFQTQAPVFILVAIFKFRAILIIDNLVEGIFVQCTIFKQCAIFLFRFFSISLFKTFPNIVKINDKTNHVTYFKHANIETKRRTS